MMETGNVIPMSRNEDLENVNGTSNGTLGVEGLAENFGNASELTVNNKFNSGQECAEVPTLPPHLTSNSKEPGFQMPDEPKNLKPLEGMTRADKGRPFGKGKDGKKVRNSSNGNIASQSRPKQIPVLGTKLKSFKEKESSDIYKATSAQNTTQFEHQQPHGLPSLLPSSTRVEQPEELLKKTKLKGITKDPSSTADEFSQSSLNPTAVETKPLKLGTLPTYNFSFKCNERAEKRKEFYLKLEEKIQAKDAEKSNLQAKTKETEEAEIKMWRKSLAFKATPMPSFYQEPPAPKAEIKKIPTTRAKSPKLGRKKNSTGTKETRPRLPRLSLDEKLSQRNLARRTTRNDRVKKTQRMSLPKLPSEDNALSYEKNKKTSSCETSSSKESCDHEVQPKVLTEEERTSAGTIEGASEIDEELPEAREEIAKVQENCCMSPWHRSEIYIM